MAFDECAPGEATVDEALQRQTEGLEQGRDYQRRGDNHQGTLLLLVEETAQQGTEDEHEANVDQGQDYGQDRIDERATNEDIDIP